MSEPRVPGEILEFWFSERVRPLWFKTSPAFDEEIRQFFGPTVGVAIDGGLDYWNRAANSSLALVLLLDQFPRNIHRGTPRAFAGDARARSAAGYAIERRFDRQTPLDRRHFFYLPFEHSENAEDQRRCVDLFQAWVADHDGSARQQASEQMAYVHRHQEIIDRFGRFPHRNEILGRDSTPAELEFLKEANSSF